MDNLSQPHALAGPSQQPLQTCVRCPRKCLCDRCAQDLQPSTWRPALLTCWCCPPPSLPPWWCWGSWQRAIKKVKLVHVGHWQKSSHNFHTPIRLQENSARHADIWNTITSPCAGPHVPNIAGIGPYKARNNTPGLCHSWQFASCWDFIFRHRGQQQYSQLYLGTVSLS